MSRPDLRFFQVIKEEERESRDSFLKSSKDVADLLKSEGPTFIGPLSLEKLGWGVQSTFYLNLVKKVG